jgi:uncharacterized membrane protein YiaA
MITKRKLNYHLYLSLFGLSILVIFSYGYWTGSPELTSKLGAYIQVITLVIFSVTSMITMISFKHQMEDRSRMIGIQYANMNQSNMADIDKMFLASPLLDRLYFEMYSNDPHIQRIKQMKNIQNQSPNFGEEQIDPNVLKMEHQAANIIFQKIADIYACEQIGDYTDLSDSVEWINTFRSWFKSPILKSHWNYLKHEQHPDVRKFIDSKLIEKNTQQ